MVDEVSDDGVRYRQVDLSAVPGVRKHKLSVSSNRQRGPFLKGPISLMWLERAGRLPGKALHVALVIRHVQSLNRGDGTIVLTNQWLKNFGIDHHAKRRALVALEEAKLIAVERGKRSPTVTIVEVAEDITANGGMAT
jgi:hypothetical protein